LDFFGNERLTNIVQSGSTGTTKYGETGSILSRRSQGYLARFLEQQKATIVSAYTHQRDVLGLLESPHLDCISPHERRNHDISPCSLHPRERSVRETSQNPVAWVPADDSLVVDVAVSFIWVRRKIGTWLTHETDVYRCFYQFLK
jgi:hypothetical protein